MRATVYRTPRVLRIEYANGQVLFDDGQKSVRYLPRQKIVEETASSLAPAATSARQRRPTRGVECMS